MSERPPPPDRVPTLTEVVHVAPMPGIDALAPAAVVDEALIVEAVLAALQGQIGAAMAPALARAMERVLHETRLALARTLREQVAEAVAHAVAETGGRTVPPAAA